MWEKKQVEKHQQMLRQKSADQQERVLLLRQTRAREIYERLSKSRSESAKSCRQERQRFSNFLTADHNPTQLVYSPTAATARRPGVSSFQSNSAISCCGQGLYQVDGMVVDLLAYNKKYDVVRCAEDQSATLNNFQLVCKPNDKSGNGCPNTQFKYVEKVAKTSIELPTYQELPSPDKLKGRGTETEQQQLPRIILPDDRKRPNRQLRKTTESAKHYNHGAARQKYRVPSAVPSAGARSHKSSRSGKSGKTLPLANKAVEKHWTDSVTLSSVPKQEEQQKLWCKNLDQLDSNGFPNYICPSSELKSKEYFCRVWLAKNNFTNISRFH